MVKEECVPGTNPRGTYQVIAQALRERIVAGVYEGGLPSEAAIGQEFSVARTTVRRALRALEEAGDVKAVAGVGRTVAGGVDVAPYERIVNDLLEQIRSGALPVGAQLPSEAQLAGQYGVARGTVRRAVRELETSGHVEARHGVGRFVSSPS
ncbi:hypothetical protein GCM10010275_01980 [Streptomyces litmocidini]|nr:hypothetical protein GCM10010275_01980 [Streptomyces litmocidini]